MSGDSGTGDGTVSYSVSENEDENKRQGTITIAANKTFTVTQEGRKCNVSISSTSKKFDSDGGTGEIKLTTTDENCFWTAASDVSWIEIKSGKSGSGDGAVVYAVSKNTSADLREGTISIAGAAFGVTFTVIQEGGEVCDVSISSTSKEFEAAGGTGSISITASSGDCAWTAASNNDWITITSGSSGSGNGAVAYSVSINTGENERTGTITIANKTFTVFQKGETGCDYSLSSSSKEFDIDGGTGFIVVRTSSGDCGWTAASNNDWITILLGSGGNGNGSVSYSVAANTGADRKGTMTIAGTTFTALQKGKEIVGKPELDIKANDSDGPITVDKDDNILITVEVDSNGVSANCDWWLARKSSSGWHYFDLWTGSWMTGVLVTLQAPLFDIGPIMVSGISGLSAGSYTFFFAVDTNADGAVGAPIYYDYVIVNANASGMDIEGEGQEGAEGAEGAEGVEGEAIDAANTTSAEGYK